MADEAVTPAGRPNRRARVVLVSLIAIFVSLCVAAEWHKSITEDELVYTVAGYINLHTGDFRMSPEHPPLWRMWAALDTLNFPLAINYHGVDWLVMPQEVTQYWRFSVDTAYRTPGNNPERLIWRCRPMMIAIGVMLAVLIGTWARQLGGASAAVVTTALFCLDPNFLAHSSLVTNDVPVTFAMVLATYAVWRLGNRVTPWRVLLLGLACGLCLTTKLSGLLIVPLVVALLLLRAITPGLWTVLGRVRATRGPKTAAALGAIACSAMMSYGIIWASYNFRFAAVADNGLGLNVQREVDEYAKHQLEKSHPDRPPTAAERSSWRPPLSISGILFLLNHRALPEGWLFGVLFNLQNTQSHPAFLVGDHRDTGWWYYFPLVVFFKTPTATLIVMGAAAAVLLWQCVSRRKRRDTWQQHGWIVLCLGLPILLYAAVAVRTPMDIGIRYIFPLYAWMYIAAGSVAAYTWRLRPRLASVAGAVLAVALATETAVAFPNYLSFFNVMAGGSRGGIRLLGDSNLDWGQDLFALRDWQRAHPAADLYLCYFGIADPAFYGIRYTPLPGGYVFDRAPRAWPTHACTVAISATCLQGIYMSSDLRARYAALLKGKPGVCLNGSMYLFDINRSKQ